MRPGFPPGTSWGPLAIGVLIAVVFSLFSFAPMFGPHVVATVGDGGGSQGLSPSGNPTGTSDPGSTTAGPGGQRQGGASASVGNPNGYQCTADKNGGATAPGVTSTDILIATTKVTGGDGSGFLGQAVDGMNAALDQFNSQNPQGICGRHVRLPGENAINDDWQGDKGKQYIDSFIHSGKVFALVAQPDSEGLDAAQHGGDIDAAGMPVVGTDGLLGRQYGSPWVWPVGASTASNMHIIAKYWASKGKSNFAIVYDNKYKFGQEGARAFDQEVFRQTGNHIPGAQGSAGSCPAGQGAKFCGIDPSQSSYQSEITAFNGACSPCDVVVMLLTPGTFGTWMQQEQSASAKWFNNLVGGEPLFNHNVAVNCGVSCNQMTVWTGYRPAVDRFFTGKVTDFCNALKREQQSDDCENEFTQGAYLGTQMFLTAVQKAGPNLTRENLKKALDSLSFDSGLTASPLTYGPGLPHQANVSMAQFSDNFHGSFNGWNYVSDGPEFWTDPHPHTDLQ